MLNEKDFTEIGKRIYDLEADPPRKGWDKIAGGLKDQSGKGGFFSRNWWKPLVLLLPLSVWMAVNQGLLRSDDLSARINPGAGTENSVRNNAKEEKALNMEDTLSRSQHSEKLPTLHEETLAMNRNNTPVETYDNVDGNDHADIIRANDNTIIPSPPAEPSQVLKSVLTPDVPVLTMTDETSQPAESNPPLITTADNNNNSTTVMSPTTVPLADENPAEKSSPNGKNSEIPLANIAKETAVKDSLPDQSITMDFEQTEAASDERKKEQFVGTWRITAAVAPIYLIKSVRPVVGDEVVVTKMESRRSFEHLGFNAAFGVGKEIRKNLFIDAQATFLNLKENFSYSYTTGRVDTLIARRDEDGNVRVTPVYAAESASISSQLNYGGIRLSGIYYFWHRGRTRFNISAAGGANFLLYSNVKENISGEWTNVASNRAQKSLYNLTVGAGYNVRLGSAWELQINPSLTYYSGKGNSYRQILNLNQRSYGVSFMVSKFF